MERHALSPRLPVRGVPRCGDPGAEGPAPGKLAAALAAAEPLPPLPADDLPPETAVGWPPEGSGFPTYVEEGFAALDAYLSGGFAP